MLQITSGRFWGYVERYKSEHSTPIYSLASLSGNVNLPVGTLEPCLTEDATGAAAILSYQSGLPNPTGGLRVGVLVATGGKEIEEQFVALLTVSTGRLWDIEKDKVTRFVDAVNNRKSALPLLVEPKNIDSKVTELFFQQTLSLPRSQYTKVVSAAIALHHAVSASTISYDAAFSMAVFALESLVPSDGDGVNWTHFPQPTGQKLDEVLPVNSELGGAVRMILLEDGNFKLQARFLKFVNDHLEQGFFRSSGGIRRSDIMPLLRNAYSGRSGFVHALDSIEKPITNLEMDRMITWKNGEPHFTLQGVFSVAFEVLRRLVKQGTHSEAETGINWWGELPGLTTMRLSHEYWLWQPEAFQGNDMRERFSDVVEYLYIVRSGASKLVNLRDGIGSVVNRFEQLPKDQRRLVLGMSVLWAWIAPEEPIPGANELFERHKECFDAPSFESLILHVLGNSVLPWGPNTSADLWCNYIKNRYKKKTIRVPHQIESAIRGTIANNYLACKNLQEFANWCELIADDEGHRPDVILHVNDSLSAERPLDIQLLLAIRLN